jgi:hypothetical protein
MATNTSNFEPEILAMAGLSKNAVAIVVIPRVIITVSRISSDRLIVRCMSDLVTPKSATG